MQALLLMAVLAHSMLGTAALPVAPSYGTALRESVGADALGAGDSLECAMLPGCPHVWLGERPRFRIRIRNRSSRAVLLVPPLDGSSRDRYPRIRFVYDGPPGGVHPVPLLYCGNQND